MTKMLSKNDAKISIGRNRFRGRPTAKDIPRLVARRAVRGEVNLPPGGRRFGRKKKRRKANMKKKRKEDLKKWRCSTRPDPKGRRILLFVFDKCSFHFI